MLVTEVTTFESVDFKSLSRTWVGLPGGSRHPEETEHLISKTSCSSKQARLMTIELKRSLHMHFRLKDTRTKIGKLYALDVVHCSTRITPDLRFQPHSPLWWRTLRKVAARGTTGTVAALHMTSLSRPLKSSKSSEQYTGRQSTDIVVIALRMNMCAALPRVVRLKNVSKMYVCRNASLQERRA